MVLSNPAIQGIYVKMNRNLDFIIEAIFQLPVYYDIFEFSYQWLTFFIKWFLKNRKE